MKSKSKALGIKLTRLNADQTVLASLCLAAVDLGEPFYLPAKFLYFIKPVHAQLLCVYPALKVDFRPHFYYKNFFSHFYPQKADIQESFVVTALKLTSILISQGQSFPIEVRRAVISSVFFVTAKLFGLKTSKMALRFFQDFDARSDLWNAFADILWVIIVLYKPVKY